MSRRRDKRFAFYPGGRAGVSVAQVFRSDLPPVDAVAVVEADLVLTILDSEYAAVHLAEVAQWLGFVNRLVLEDEAPKAPVTDLAVVKGETP